MDIGASFNLTINLSNTKIESIRDTASICCPACSKPFGTRYRNINCFHVLCHECIENSTKCKLCNSLTTAVDILHPNEELFLCPKENCRRGFINFSSVSYHVQLYHSEEDWIGTEIIDILPKFNYDIPAITIKKNTEPTALKHKQTPSAVIPKTKDDSPVVEDDYLPTHLQIPTPEPMPVAAHSTINISMESGLDIEDLENLM
ncbi:zinc finger protein, putative [Babesia microti strain RI]|uniref:Zinc finger protein, putative n=1 Tax=Babesia microti (strain RI) TaxID=1133968 RepID=A0A0K3AV13_BABMR|nr:zinc finger protein, putative [Babesia microti strain RI]CTQ41441.1 zinc finger protein, putative [Babesia microti strain RI]|eukprot:XP_012649452.1 zinc finger protein, putative [Babesia microti strain RI]